MGGRGSITEEAGKVEGAGEVEEWEVKDCWNPVLSDKLMRNKRLEGTQADTKIDH